MKTALVIKGVYIVPMGMANAFLMEGDDGLILIDAGFPGKEAAVFKAIHALGRSRDQLKTSFSLTHIRIMSAAPLRSCAKVARGPICTRSISQLPRAEALFGL